MKKIFLLLLLLSAQKAYLQDVHFSQFAMAPIFINPANSGAENKIRAIMNYREQWKSVATPYKTLGLSYDMRVAENNSGHFAFGTSFFSDKAGDAKMATTQANMNLAYHLRIGDGMRLGMGIMAGYAQRSVNTSLLEWGNQYNGSIYDAALSNGEPSTGNMTKSFLDAGAGVVWTYVKGERYMTSNDKLSAVAGFSVLHVHQPNYSFYANPNELLYRRYIAHGNAVIGISNSKWSVAPGFFFSLQGGARELVYGSMFKYRLKDNSHYTNFVAASSIAAGVFYRNKDAVIIKGMINYANYSLGFAYDLNTSTLKPTSKGKGGFEFCLRFITPTGGSKNNSSKFL